jgi:hypothetical protein
MCQEWGKQFVYKILMVKHVYCGVRDMGFPLTKMGLNPFCHMLCFIVFPVSDICHGRMALTVEVVLSNSAVLWFWCCLFALQQAQWWGRDQSGSKVRAHSLWWWAMEVGRRSHVTVLDLCCQDASSTGSPVIVSSRTVYFCSSDAFWTKRYLFPGTVNTKVLESTSVWTWNSFVFCIIVLLWSQKCTMCEKSRRMRGRRYKFITFYFLWCPYFSCGVVCCW